VVTETVKIPDISSQWHDIVVGYLEEQGVELLRGIEKASDERINEVRNKRQQTIPHDETTLTLIILTILIILNDVNTYYTNITH